jgi:hypothetical protein
MWDEYNKWKRENPEAQEAAPRSGLIGSPVKPFAESCGAFAVRISTRVLCSTRLARTATSTSGESRSNSYSLAAMPEFRTDPEHDAWKAGDDGAIAPLEEIDTEASGDCYGQTGRHVMLSKPQAGGG